jgi:hypothetical protein
MNAHVAIVAGAGGALGHALAATLAASGLTHAVAPEAIAGVIAFLGREAAAPVSGAILPAYGA